MKTTIPQIFVLTHSLIQVWLSPYFPQTSASREHQCNSNQYHGAWDHQLFNLTYMHTPLPDTRIFQHNERDACPSYHSFFQHEHMGAQDLSLCPWTYVKSYDPDRFPMEMYYARCSCKKCVSWDMSGFRHECKAHYYAFNVIRRVCEDGRYKYYHAHEYMPIACVCSHEHVRFVRSSG